MIRLKKVFNSNWIRWAEHVARMKQDDILTYKFKGEKSLGKPRVRREIGIKFDLT